jgi:hypothetical protein
MKRWIVVLGTCAALSALPMHASAHGHGDGSAVLGGIVGGVVGGLIGSTITPYPVYAATAPIVVERYAPAPIVVESYAPPQAVYYPAGRRGWYDREWRGHPRHERHWDDDD